MASPRISLRLPEDMLEWITARGTPTEVVTAALEHYRRSVDWKWVLDSTLERQGRTSVAYLLSQIEATLHQLLAWLDGEVAAGRLQWHEPSKRSSYAVLERGRMEWEISRPQA